MSESAENSFRTHANYIGAFATLCRSPYRQDASPFGPSLAIDLPALAAVIVKSPSLGSRGGGTTDANQARLSLVNAWGTELLLAFAGTVAFEDDLMRVMNNWAVVQAYYASYHAVQSLIVARGDSRPQSHTSTQNQFANLWADRVLDLPPWTLAACHGGFRNDAGAGRPLDDSIQPWIQHDTSNSWDLSAKALRTTRQETIKMKTRDARERKRQSGRAAWKAEEVERLAKGRRARKEPKFPLPQLAEPEKVRVAQRVRSFTILDYLYRLRIKANYEDAAMFIDGPVDGNISTLVHKNLEAIVSSTLLLHELHVASLVGRDEVLAWMDEWVAITIYGKPMGVGLRRDVLSGALT